jgi:SP family arabinose:H+ symporter-like MFS transporter
VQQKKTSQTIYTVVVAFIAATGGFLFGYDLNVIVGAQPFLRAEFDMSATEFGFAVSSALLGCLAGPLFGGWLCDYIGRKRTLMVSALLFGISAIGTAIPDTLTEFNIYRFIGGIGVGLASVTSPMYLAEIAPARSRGKIVTLNQFAIVAGSLFAIILSHYLAVHLPKETSWRWMFGSEVVPVIIFFIALMFVPFSPRWLAEKGREAEALQVLTRFNGAEAAQAEMEDIHRSLEEEQGGFGELLRPGMRMALLVGIGVAALNQWAGWPPISFYMSTIFQKAGFEQATDALFQSVIANVANLFFTIVGFLLVDRVGRRPLWIVCSLLMAFATFLLGLFFVMGVTGTPILIAVLISAAAYATALGPLAWLIIAEIFPTRIRARAMCVCTIALWIMSFAVTQATPMLFEFFEQRTGSPGYTFWIYSVVCLLSFLFGIIFIPETKNKTLEEISDQWLTNEPTT